MLDFASFFLNVKILNLMSNNDITSGPYILVTASEISSFMSSQYRPRRQMGSKSLLASAKLVKLFLIKASLCEYS